MESNAATAGAGLPGDPLELGLGEPRPQAGAEFVEFDLTEPLAARARALAGQRGVGLGTVLRAALCAVLLRYTGKAEFPLDRPRLRFDASGEPSFGELLARLAAAGWRAEDEAGDRAADTPATLAVAGLVVTFRPVGGALRGRLEYDPASLAPPAARRLPGHLSVLLEAACADPGRGLWSLPLLTEPEELRFEQWNATAVDYRWDVLVPELIARQAEASPDAVALVHEGETLDYRTLHERVNRLAWLLRERGLGPGDRVGVLIDRSFDFVVAALAVLTSGAAYVPLDPGLPPGRLGYLVEDCQPATVLTRSDNAALLPPHDIPVIALDADAASISRQPATAPEPAARGGDVAFVIYTSGSTGRPKGTLNTHRGLLNRLLWQQDTYRIGPGDAVVMKTSCGFDVSLWELCWPLMTGARTVVAAPNGHRDPRYLARLIESERATVIHFVPSMLRTFLETAELERCRGLRQVFSGGEALTPQLRRQFFDSGLTAALDNLYGPAEAAIDVTRWRCAPDEPGARVPIGRPIANTSVRVLDRHRNQVPVGVPGELHLGGVQLAHGYHRRPELTAQRFVPDPFGSDLTREGAPRLYATGDLGRWREDGVVEYLGRVDDQLKLRGIRIEPGEIESVLAEQPGVGRAVVLLRPAAAEPQLVAYLAAQSRQDAPSPARVRERLARLLPDYMVPRHIVVLDAIPVSVNGKIDRAALLALPLPAAGADQGGADAAARPQYVAPRDEVERTLAGIFSELLGVERVGIRDGLFDLGGHSLTAARLAARLVRDFGIELPLRTVVAGPTVEALAAALVEVALGMPEG